MKARFTCFHVRENDHIGMPITTYTDGESLVVPVSSFINQFSLATKLVGITSGGGTNMARRKEVLESNFENTGVFDSEKPMFVMECLDHVLENFCKAGIMDVQSDDGKVDTGGNRNNIQRCINLKKNTHRS